MSVLTQDININEQFIELFNEQEEFLTENSPEFINRIRRKAIDAFKTNGIPVFRSEDYKYTNLEPYFKKDLKKYLHPRNVKFGMEDLFKCDVPELDTHVIVFVNGHYYDRENPIIEFPGGILAGSFTEATRRFPELVKTFYSREADYEKNGLIALNTAFARDGLFVYAPRNAVSDKPIQVINILLSDEDQFVQQRNLIVAEENSQLDFVICDHSLSPREYLTNSVTEIVARSNASVDITNIQNEHNDCAHLSSTAVSQSANSRVTNNVVTLHGGLVRNNLHVKLKGEGCENNSFGLFLLDEKQHTDSYTLVEHMSPHCTSNQLYKGVLDENSIGAFNGKIHVWPDAQQTMAYQRNNNLLLTKDAKMHTKPQLEIYADDVKCSHGATVGQIDETALFYLRSRGISFREARLLMMYAFANEVIGKIKVAPLKERIDDLVNKRLRGELSRCNNCSINCG
ncbi:MAG TPA: Fe-S cluster assembly protein SufD [Bacteroidales bacterium]|nr:Fe-S cluster assembly protein SufD [Bacteroidales bacterium]